MIKFSLKTPKEKRSLILMSVWTCGVRYRLSSGVSVETKLWNAKQQRVRQATSNAEQASLDNERLDAVQAAAARTVAKIKLLHNPPSKEKLKEIYDVELCGERTPEEVVIPDFTDYMKIYIERYRETKSPNTTRSITTVYNKLLEFEASRRKRIMFDAIDMTLYVELSTYCAKYGYRESYFATIIKVIKQVVREARSVDKFCSVDGIDAKGFTSSSGSVENIYLTDQELRKIYNLDLSLSRLQEIYPDSRASDLQRKAQSLTIARAFFLFGAYTGLRVSDFTRLADADISDRIRLKTRKTGSEVVIPIHPIVAEIISSEIDLKSPPSPQKLNDAIKEIAKIAGICDTVHITRTVGSRKITEKKQRWELVTNHTARRSFATNAYKAGVPTISIMRITGHTKESTFMKYIKIGNEENAEALEQHPFFKG
ncbi:MAG: phage integrase SAM-like domain-containing protein [Rikenellaceae bacterium]